MSIYIYIYIATRIYRISTENYAMFGFASAMHVPFSFLRHLCRKDMIRSDPSNTIHVDCWVINCHGGVAYHEG